MKVSQPNKNLGESIAMSVLFVASSFGIFLVMMTQSGIL